MVDFVRGYMETMVCVVSINYYSITAVVLSLHTKLSAIRRT